MPTDTSQKQYYAFLSYRHADNREEGRCWATWLHQAIETYQVPPELVGKPNQLGEKIPERIYPVFRDEEELSTDSSLSDAIVRALDRSRFLLVLCSPNAVLSPYVAQEIDHFKACGGSARIIAVILDGEPNASWDLAKRDDGYAATDECFPLPLQFEYNEAGERTEQRAEPIAADFRTDLDGRSEQGWTSNEAYRRHLKRRGTASGQEIQKKVEAYQQQRHLMVLKIIAGILAVPLGELTRRDQQHQLALQQQRARKLRYWLGAMTVLAVLAVCAGVLAFFQRQAAIESEMVAREQRDSALETQSRFLTDLARQAMSEGHYDRALLLALNASPGLYGGERPSIDNHQVLYQAAVQQNKIAILGNDDQVTYAGISPDGRTIVTASREGEARVWDALSGEKRHQLTQAGAIYSASFSSDGRRIALASADGNTSVWDLHTGARGYGTKLASSAILARLSPDGNRLLSASLEGDASIVSVDSGDTLSRLDHGRALVNHAVFGPDGHLLVTATQDGALRVFDSRSGEILTGYRQDWPFVSVQFDSAGQRLLARADRHVFLFRVNRTGELTLIDVLGRSTRITDASFSLDGSLLAISAKDGDVTLHSTLSGKQPLPPLKHESAVLSVGFSGAHTLVTGTQSGHIRFWDTTTGQPGHSIDADQPVSQVEFGLAESALLTRSPGNSVTLWNPAAGRPTQSASVAGGARTLALSDDAGLIALGSAAGGVALWRVPSNEPLVEMPLHSQPVVSLKFDPTGRLLLSAADDGELRLLSLSNLAQSGSLASAALLDSTALDGTGRVSHVQFSADGEYLAIASTNGLVRLWQTKSPQLLAEFGHESGQRVRSSGFDTSSTRLVTCGDDSTVRVWDIRREESVHTFRHDDDVTNCSFSPDGNWVASSSWDGSARLWPLGHNEQGGWTLEHDAAVEHVAFRADGKALVTVSQAGTARLWSLADRTLIATYPHPGAYHASFSPDGARLVTTSRSGTVKLWSTTNATLLETFSHEGIVQPALLDRGGDRLAVVSEDFTALLWPLLDYRDGLVEAAISRLPANRTCLKPVERERYFLNELTPGAWRDRGCLQYAGDNKSMSGSESAK